MRKNVACHLVRVTKPLMFVIPAQLLFCAASFAAGAELTANNRVTEFVHQLEVSVSGTVTDTNGQPIPGVTVSVEGTTIGTATGLDGNYSLSVPDGSVLVFSFIGF